MLGLLVVVPQRTPATELRKDTGVSLPNIVLDASVPCYSGRSAPAVLASPGSLLEIQILGPYLTPTEFECTFE